MATDLEKRVARLEKKLVERRARAGESVLGKILDRDLVTARDVRLLREAYPTTKRSGDSGRWGADGWWRADGERVAVQSRVWELETLFTRLITTVATAQERRLLLDVDGLYVWP